MQQMHIARSRAVVDDGPTREERRRSRSAFFERFTHRGSAADGYLLAWRMAAAKDLLRHGRQTRQKSPNSIGYG